MSIETVQRIAAEMRRRREALQARLFEIDAKIAEIRAQRLAAQTDLTKVEGGLGVLEPLEQECLRHGGP